MSEGSELYFAPLLAWQGQAWEQVTRQFDDGKLPHGLLASGMAGIGKRAFVWRWVAWLLCTDKHPDRACGACDSCTWLKAGTHPDLRYLPKEDETAIKIDDIRELSEFVATKGNLRVIVLDNSDTMTLGAANALLKTLEEPSDGVFLLLISDNPSAILPTIKSRVQTLPLSHFDASLSHDYVEKHKNHALSASVLLQLSDFAPLSAVSLANSAWFGHRKAWLQTFVALQLGKRTPTQASAYWQQTVSLGDFLCLSRMMLVAIYRDGLGLPSLHSDLDFALLQALEMDEQHLERLQNLLDSSELALAQNVQEKLIFDNLLVAMANSALATEQ